MRLRFVSNNNHKLREMEYFSNKYGLEIISVKRAIPEIQDKFLRNIVRDKCIKAFQMVGHPLFVEHTALEIDGFNGLPGGLTQIFWDALKADGFSRLLAGMSDRRAKAISVVGYCDGKRIRLFDGAVAGKVADLPRGQSSFHWDGMFVPDGSEETFAEMREQKHEISMRAVAIERFLSSFRAAQVKDSADVA